MLITAFTSTKMTTEEPEQTKVYMEGKGFGFAGSGKDGVDYILLSDEDSHAHSIEDGDNRKGEDMEREEQRERLNELKTPLRQVEKNAKGH